MYVNGPLSRISGPICAVDRYPDPDDVLCQIPVGQHGKYGYIEIIWQQQVIDLFFEVHLCVDSE